MGKGTNFSGQPVLSQLIKLMDRSKINTLASKSGANYYTKHFDGYLKAAFGWLFFSYIFLKSR